MIPNNKKQFQSDGSYIDVPSTVNVPTSQVPQPSTPYDYLALLPALIVAITPLILGFKKKGKDNDDK